MFWPLTKGLPTVSAPTCQQQGHLLDGASTSLSRKEGHLLQDSSHQGGQLSQPEHGGPEQGRAGSSSGASTGPLAQNPRPTRSRSWCKLTRRASVVTFQTSTSQAQAAEETSGAGQPWAAGAAVDKFLGPDPYLGLVPALPCPHGEAWQLGDSRAALPTKLPDPGQTAALDRCPHRPLHIPPKARPHRGPCGQLADRSQHARPKAGNEIIGLTPGPILFSPDIRNKAAV
ncbi:hypothetical protein E5288_WYG008200 [Bos mutus]|uniref:Uncharacterized protein n=1 Tax=Bos mutus TaxID=72004 RepID=A0A6B0RXM9_9CETA|nr:hypothetical protein [Bos mutus]